MTTDQIIQADVYSEEFLSHFNAVLNKFVKEFDDMAQMTVIQKAKELLDAVNE